MVTLRHPLPGSRLTPGRGFTGPLPGHTGIDLSYGGGSCGKPVLAAADGIAKRAENGGGGHGVVVRHADGVETGYWHLSRQLVGGLLGGEQNVRAGQVIGAVGASGMVTGCHLHFEVKVNGQLRDPLPLLGGSALSGTTAHDLGHITTYPAGGCPAGYVPARIAGPLVDLPIIGATPLGSNRIEAIGAAGQAGDWNACLLASRGYQVGQDPYAPGTVPGAIANEFAEALADALPFLANGAILIAALLIGWTGVKQVVGVR